MSYRPRSQAYSVSLCWLVGWINWIEAKLSPKRYWQGPRSQEVGEEREYAYRYTVITRMTPAFRLAAMKAVLMFH